MQNALELAEEHGLPVFPCRPKDEVINGKLHEAKSPLTEHGFKDASKNLGQIEAWWKKWPDALIGVPTGKASNLIVVDVDPNGADWYREHAAELAAGRVHNTRRGQHLLYRNPAAEIRNSTSTVAPGIDVRGQGGYIIWWPAHGLHAIGDLDAVGDVGEWLLPLLTSKPKKLNGETPHASDKIHLRSRNAYLSPEAFRLRKQGASVEQIVEVLRALNTARCDPPLSDDEIVKIARGKKDLLPDSVTVSDFHAYMPMHAYIFVHSRELWPASSVNARCASPATKTVSRKVKGGGTEAVEVPMSASEWLDRNQPIDQMTWAPGLPMIITDKLVSGGGWINRPGSDCFNLYIPPQDLHGDPKQADKWLDHVRRVYPDDADHIVRWLAHRVQQPAVKPNHAIVIGGPQGIGKDTILEPVKHAVGPWNFADVSPAHMLGRFNGFVKSVILRVSEARDLGDIDRYAFYDHLKVYTAAPPDVLRCDEKNLREHAVMNVSGVIITSNHKTDGIYLPADDRRHYVAWSALTKDDFPQDYWRDLYAWYANDGIGHVAAYLRALDLSTFDPKAPPPKTAAFWDIVDANRAPEDAELADVLDLLTNPIAVTVAMLCVKALDEFREWLLDRRNSRQLPHRMESVGYVAVRNDADKRDGLWIVDGKRQVIYARKDLSVRDRIAAARTLTKGRTW